MQQRPSVPEVEPLDAWERVRRGEAVIVDVREPDEVAEVSVLSAIHIPLGQLASQVATIPPAPEVLFLCRSGHRSAYATEFFLRQRQTPASNIRGGIIAWHEIGLPTIVRLP